MSRGHQRIESTKIRRKDITRLNADLDSAELDFRNTFQGNMN